MKKSKLFQKALVVLILIIFCLEHLSILSIAAGLTEFRLESKKYLISEGNGYISRIIPETTIAEFKSYFNVEADEIHVYKDASLKQEVTNGYIGSGMYLACDKIDETYELSVIGDLTHEGELDQIDLNLLIKHVVGLKAGQLQGIDRVSADLSGDQKIDQVDITILIRYIVYHELYVPEIKRPSAPIIEVISGTKGEEDWYSSDVVVSIKENKITGVKVEKTVYKVSGTSTKGETQISEEETIKLVNEGEYKITAYSYSNEGAKSVASEKTIKIDKTAPKLNISTETDLNKITVKAQATDNLSGVKDYTYYIGIKNMQNNEIVWSKGGTTTEREHTFENLVKGTEYYVKVEVQDKAGNINSREEKVSTTNIPALVDDKKAEELGDGTKPNVKVEKSEEDWTNEDVIIKIEVDPDVDPEGKYDLEYSKDGGETWEPYDPEEGIKVEENTDVEIRLTDGEDHGESITVPVTNIDKVPPELEIKTKATSNSIKVKAEATDEGSGVKEYTYYIGEKDEEGNIHWSEGIKSVDPEHIFTDLETEKEYEIKVEVEDKAGNKTEKQTTQKTEKVPELIDDKKSEESKDPEDPEGKPTKLPNVKVEKSEDDWTNEDVTIKIELDPDLDPDGDYDIEYSKDGGETWEPYDPEKGITVEENQDVEIRLTDGENHGEGITVTVDNIDKILPELEIEATGTSNSITVKAEATDEPSGVKDYTYYIGEEDEEGNIIWKDGITTTDPEYTFKGLEQDKEYHIKVEVSDKAGNKTEEQTKAHTSEIPELVDDKKSEESKDPEDPEGKPTKEPNVTVEKSTEDWTNEDVIIKVELDPDVDPEDKYELEYSKDGGETWEPYDPEKGITVEENTDVEIRLTDGENHGEGITVPVTNIDKNPPIGTLDGEPTKTSITAKVDAEDELSGIKEYIFYIGEKDEDGNITWSEGIPTTEPEHTFENLEDNKSYPIKVEIVDNAGNVTTLEKEIMTLEDFGSGNYITMTQSNKKWTNKDVTVTITSKPTEYITEYKVNDGEWTEFKDKQEITLTENGTVYGRIRDGEKIGDIVSLTISNIDKEAPEVEIEPSDITSRSFKVNMNAKDDLSGIVKIVWYYKPETEEMPTQETYQYAVVGSTVKGKLEVEKEYSYTDLVSGNYWVVAEITDSAGNVTITEAVYVEPITITAGAEGIEVTANKNWTNQDVEVTMASNDNRYSLLTSLDKENWATTKNYTVTENGSVYGKLTDGINSGEILEYKVTNIDKQKSVVTLEAEEVTSKKFTIDLDFKDENTSSAEIASNASGLGKITWYYRNIINEDYIEVPQDYQVINGLNAGNTDTHKQLTIDNLVKGTYEIYAVVTDVAGNIVNTKDGIEGETTTPVITVELEEITPGKDAITLTSSNTNWTNKPVTIDATNTDERYEIQLSTDDKNYETKDQITVTGNTDVYARLTDGVNAGESTKITIDKIDTSPAVANIQNTDTTSKTFTVEADVTDNASGLARIDWYMRKKGEEEYQVTTKDYQTINGPEAGELNAVKDITFEGLTSGTYEVYAVVTDVAGNQTTTTQIEVTLLTITNGSNGIEITSSNENWTNEDVQMTAKSTDERYTVQTSSDGVTYRDEETINYEQNGTIYARLTDGVNVGEPTSKIFNNIDKVNSNVSVEVTEITSRAFTQTINVIDNASGLSKIEIYYRKSDETEFKVKEVEYQEEKGKVAGETDTSKSITVDGLKSGTYEVYVVVTDVAGNKTSTERSSKIITLETITPGEGTITLTQSTNGWTNQPVTVTAENTDDKYQIQITKNGIDWEVADEITVEENTTVSARLYDGVNSGETISLTISNIDRSPATGEVECTDKTTKSMDIKVTAEDIESGIASITWYYQRVGDELVESRTQSYRTINGTETGDYNKEVTETFDNLKSGTYIVYAVITDVAGNETTTQSINVTLNTVTSAKEAVTLTPNINYWTNTDVIVTATSSDPNFILQTSTDGENWDELTELTITENQTVYARLYDGVNGGETASLTIGNIDKENPTSGEITNTPGGTSLTLSLNVYDDIGGVAKVEWYYKEENEENYTAIADNYAEINGTETGYYTKMVTRIIPELEAGKTYDVYAEIYDVAGNMITTESIKAITNQAPEIGEVTYASKTTSSITVTTSATDADEDELTYTIYTSENAEGPYIASGTATGASGANVTLTANGLSEYTNYYYYVEVSDKIATDESSKGLNAKTYCPTTYCSGQRLVNQTCYTCSGSGKIYDNCSTCGGSGSVDVTCSTCGGSKQVAERCTGHYIVTSDSSAHTCLVKGCGGTMRVKVFGCSSCSSGAGEYLLCSKCGYTSNSDVTGQSCRSSIYKTCTTCNGSGRNGLTTCNNCNGSGTSYTYHSCSACSGNGYRQVTGACEHGKSSVHYHCQHGTSYSSNVHD